jgi:hypothetical protein
VLKSERDGEIHAEQIKRLAFESIHDIATDTLYEDELKARALTLRRAWDEYERVKKDQRWALQRIVELETEVEVANQTVQNLKALSGSEQAEIQDLRRSLRESEHLNLVRDQRTDAQKLRQ